jgi:hypothetical protein
VDVEVNSLHVKRIDIEDIVSYVYIVRVDTQPLLQIDTIATRTHFTVATGLIWPVATVGMWHSSDGRLRHHGP